MFLNLSSFRHFIFHCLSFFALPSFLYLPLTLSHSLTLPQESISLPPNSWLEVLVFSWQILINEHDFIVYSCPGSNVLSRSSPVGAISCSDSTMSRNYFLKAIFFQQQDRIPTTNGLYTQESSIVDLWLKFHPEMWGFIYKLHVDSMDNRIK